MKANQTHGYKVVASGVYEGKEFSAETELFRSRAHARRRMRRLIREAERANGYRLPEYGGKDDCEQSIRVNRDVHVYEFNDGSGDYLQWDVVQVLNQPLSTEKKNFN